jgi:hypothetical protein
MAELKRGVLGRVTGSIGNITGRIRSGKNYLSARPASFIPGNDQGSIDRREKFKLLINLSSSILQNSPDLKLIWKKNAPGMLSSHNMIVKENYHLAETDRLTIFNIITPPSGFPLTLTSIGIEDGLLTIVTSPIGNPDLFNTELDKKIKLASLIYNQDPNIAGINQYSFQMIATSEQDLQFDDPYTFTVQLNSVQTALYSKYGNHNFYTAAIVMDTGANPVKYSITCAN